MNEPTTDYSTRTLAGARKEVRRLRELVKTAYSEGWNDRENVCLEEDGYRKPCSTSKEIINEVWEVSLTKYKL